MLCLCLLDVVEEIILAFRIFDDYSDNVLVLLNEFGGETELRLLLACKLTRLLIVCTL